MRKLNLFAVLSLALALFSAPAKANVIYDIHLNGAVSGTGVLSIVGPIDPFFQSINIGSSSPAGTSINDFRITIGGHEFNLTNTYTNVSFLSSNLFSMGFSAFFAPLSLSASGTQYTFFNSSTRESANGTISLTVAAPVPGPIIGAGIPSLIMAFGGLIAWRRRRNQAAVV